MATKEDKRTYILNMKDGTKQKITVPSAWKLTFGPLTPGSKEHSMNSSGALVLRIYEGNKDNQRAVFTGVESWRDTQDLSIEVEQVQSKQQMARVDIPGEGQKDVACNMEIRQWVNPDSPVQPAVEFGQLNGELPRLSAPKK